MRGLLLGLAVGMVVGVSIGWVAFHREASVPSAATLDSGRSRPSSPGLEASPANRAPVAGPAQPAPSVFRNGTTREIWEALNAPPSPSLSADEARDLLPRLEEAIRSGDSVLFNAVVEALGRSGEAFAHEALVAVLARHDLPLPDGAGRRFGRVLAKSDVPGIAAAARMRFEQAVAAGDTSWVAANGWFVLVALHGDDADIAWLSERAESSQIQGRAQTALAMSPHPEAIRRFLESARDGDFRDIHVFVQHHPEEAWALWPDLMAAPDADVREIV